MYEDFNSQNEASEVIHDVSRQDNFFVKTFFWMFLGLISTAFFAAYTYYSGFFAKVLIGNYFNLLLILEVVVVLLFSFLFRKLSPTMVGILYFIYAGINGITMSVIFAVFELNSIILLFLVSAGLFGALALYGYKTSKDLSNWHTLLFDTLLAGLITSLINLILKNSMLDIILDWVILFVFFGITAYDMNKLKSATSSNIIAKDKIHIYFAMELYLDFINIFLRVLSLLGKRRRD